MIENRPSLRRYLIRWLIRILVKTILRPWVPVRLQRSLLDVVALITGPPRHPKPEAVKLGSVPGRRYLVRDRPADTAVLYLHGGGYVAGSSKSHRNISARLGLLLGADVYAIDYRLAPEHPYPTAVDDVVEAYVALRDPKRGYRRIVVVGDSAGGALAVILPLRVRDEGELPVPDAVVAFSPFVDHTEEAPDDAYDDMLDPRWGELVASWYLRDAPKDHPYISPVFADLHGLPPTLIQVGGDELLA
ncbi:MAG: alpha/beta hydrolase, partial [Pseudomonadota bacterium]